jgi:hypothetical protein
VSIAGDAPFSLREYAGDRKVGRFQHSCNVMVITAVATKSHSCGLTLGAVPERSSMAILN